MPLERRRELRTQANLGDDRPSIRDQPIGLLRDHVRRQTYPARFSAILGLLLLAASTAALLVITVTTPAWVTALLLSGRGFAIGLTIQPLLLLMLAGLSPQEVPDGNTLFNVAERLGGSIGIPLLVTFFVLREQDRVRAALQSFGVPAGALQAGAGSTAHIPSALRIQLAQAASAGFHDTIWLLVAISVLGCVAALLLRRRQPATGPDALATREPVGVSGH